MKRLNVSPALLPWMQPAEVMDMSRGEVMDMSRGEVMDMSREKDGNGLEEEGDKDAGDELSPLCIRCLDAFVWSVMFDV